MGDILSVGQNQNCLTEQEQWIDTSNFLQKDQYLGEFSNEFPGPNGETVDEKGLIRENLEIYSKDDVDDLIDRRIDEELDNLIDLSDSNYQEFRNFLYDAITTRIQNYANTINNTLQGYIKKDGSIPFTGRQSGVTPTANNHLATKSYVDRVAVPKVQEYLDSNEFKAFVDQTIGGYVRLYIPEGLSQLREEIQASVLELNTIVSTALESFNAEFNNGITLTTSEVQEQESVTMTIEESNYCSVSSISVVMGEDDITSSVWDDTTGTITIETVTDDITIKIITTNTLAMSLFTVIIDNVDCTNDHVTYDSVNDTWIVTFLIPDSEIS